MIIKNEKELDELLESKIVIPVYWNEAGDPGTISEGRITIDEEGMRDEFEIKLKEIVEAVSNY